MDFKWKHFKSDIILRAVRWYVAYPLSYRQVEEMLKERGLEVDHSSIQRWVVEYSPQLAKKFASHKKAVGKSWRMDETYIKVKGVWHYLYRAVDKIGQTIDFYLSKRRDMAAAKRVGALGKRGGCINDQSVSSKAFFPKSFSLLWQTRESEH